MSSQYEDLFDKPLSEYNEEELLEMAVDIRTRRKYPAVEKKEAKAGNAIDDLISGFVIGEDSKDKAAADSET